ncbi:helix-turn-helix transcriptional regulator [Brevibacterium aurantiacum]|uniref:Helix-turn-helix domain-containing protein n=1 Tax=Brevibacterium aurantiacum TaxID=273384 RepID=A0A2H1K3A8_BREAU|nr:hypothetical protein BAU01nite_20220 [Brevibacterium aurantiacum]SMX94183.1 Helix-turn-helix domain-containing protein [Brevibacterium aurantiacum]
MKTKNQERLLTRAEAADFLQVDRSTLSRWFQQGRGPRCLYLESRTPRYRLKDLLAYLEGA